jgi:hypothetical protein
VNLSTGSEDVLARGITGQSQPAAPSPDGTVVYWVDGPLFGVAAKAGVLGSAVVARGAALTCGPTWVARGGTRVYTGCGPTYGPLGESADGGGSIASGPALQSVDGGYYSELWSLDDPSTPASPIAGVGEDPGGSSSAPNVTSLMLYDPVTLSLQATMPFPLLTAGGVTYPTVGQFVFYDSTGTTRFELIEGGTSSNPAWGVASF